MDIAAAYDLHDTTERLVGDAVRGRDHPVHHERHDADGIVPGVYDAHSHRDYDDTTGASGPTRWTSGPVEGGTYIMNFGTLTAPTVDPATDTYTREVAVTMAAAPGATIRYTTNGSSVTESSPVYASSIALTATTTVKARAYQPDYSASAETTRTYTIAVATPQLSHTAGTYPAGQVLTITTTAGATLRYTINGATPTQTDSIVPASGIVVGNFTLKVGAWKTGASPSAIVTATYTVTGSVTAPMIASGDSHTLAVRDDGTVWAWGGNANGRLGDGTQTSRPLPVLTSALSGAMRGHRWRPFSRHPQRRDLVVVGIQRQRSARRRYHDVADSS